MPEASGRPDGLDAQQAMRIERTERPDGRYLIYYSWPELQPSDEEPTADDDRREGSADV
jgi:hypothetical protein